MLFTFISDFMGSAVVSSYFLCDRYNSLLKNNYRQLCFEKTLSEVYNRI